ncbi:hypothetical protein LZK80_09550 [Rhizobium leguminosarum]|nr:hypothetical protein LZK80_09550 [Rhizobium leguminosarum]
MPQDGKDDDGNPIEHTADNNETLGDALSKAGIRAVQNRTQNRIPGKTQRNFEEAGYQKAGLASSEAIAGAEDSCNEARPNFSQKLGVSDRL